MKRFWISFSGEGAHGFRGVIITRAASATDALDRVKGLRKSPGGQALVCELPPGAESQWPEDTLISKEQLRAHGYLSTRELKLQDLLDALHEHADITTIICDKHT